MEEIKETEEFFSQIDRLAQESQKKHEKPLVIIDAQNVAMRHGKNSLFSVKGI